MLLHAFDMLPACKLSVCLKIDLNLLKIWWK